MTIRQLIAQTYRIDGLGGYYKGFWSTFWRDVPGWGVYFYSYEGLKELFKRAILRLGYLEDSNEYKRREFLFRLMAGGFAGQLSWIISFPFDVVKTQIQCNMTGGKTPKMGKMFRELYAKHGWRHFFKGLMPTLIRAFPVNGVVLVTFNYTSERFS